MQASYKGKEVKPTRHFDDLVSIMAILRKECPWDKKQTHESLKDLMVEEIYEAIEAIDNSDLDELKKELGDIMLHVVFHAEMAKETDSFDIGDVIFGIQDKLIRRHPHVFSTTVADDSDAVVKNWENLKMQEQDRKSVLQGVPSNLPGLLRAQRMQDKAGAVGFDWQEWAPAWDKLQEEIAELREVIEQEDKTRARDEFGDVLFSMVNVGRLLGLDAEDSIRLTNTKFQKRFEYIEQELAKIGKQPAEVSLEEMDTLWEEAKKA